MNNEEKEVAREAIVSSIKSHLFGLPGRALLKEYRAFNPTLTHNVTKYTLPGIFSDIFLLEGTVKKSGTFYYLELQDDFVGAASDILDSTESLPSGLSIFPPPSPIGSHVTLRRPLPSHDLGKRYRFTLDDRISSYSHEGGGKIPSGFDKTLYPVYWYVIYVHGLPSHLVNPHDPPHISIAVSGFRK